MRHGEDHFCGPRVHRFLAGAAILFDLAHFAPDDDYSIVQALHNGGGGVDTSQLDNRLVVSHCSPPSASQIQATSALQRRLGLLSPIKESLNSSPAFDITGHVNQLLCIDHGDYVGIRGLQVRGVLIGRLGFETTAQQSEERSEEVGEGGTAVQGGGRVRRESHQQASTSEWAVLHRGVCGHITFEERPHHAAAWDRAQMGSNASLQMSAFERHVTLGIDRHRRLSVKGQDCIIDVGVDFGDEGRNQQRRMNLWTTSTTPDPPQARSSGTDYRTSSQRRHLSTTPRPRTAVSTAAGVLEYTMRTIFTRLHVRRFLAGAVILFDLGNLAHDDDYRFVQALQYGGGSVDTSELKHGLLV
ncbi:hypothetical protein IW261DRAFT_1597446 [Armillaria novae-zelandiae]|uniref:Uncharacterized protein n=1 Tax=Armillaria novae-zelandiae TaxID=153914 RepID=A0AA39NSW4_9AGAR|nr:hypothetical protein IW261DRAFT_1597446 [Armillaria novae-zelandiae]